VKDGIKVDRDKLSFTAIRRFQFFRNTRAFAAKEIPTLWWVTASQQPTTIGDLGEKLALLALAQERVFLQVTRSHLPEPRRVGAADGEECPHYCNVIRSGEVTLSDERLVLGVKQTNLSILTLHLQNFHVACCY
jgi:hypothetical protein